MEIKTYAMRMLTEDVFDALQNKTLDELMDVIQATKGFVGVHPTADGSSTFFLFLTPLARNDCLAQAVEMGFRADLVLNPAYVNADDLK